MDDGERFGERIAPATLVALVRSAVPWLARLQGAVDGERASLAVGGALGFVAALRAGERLAATARPSPDERLDHLALCLAAHHATVASFVPTDVDATIRGHAWSDVADGAWRARALDLVAAAIAWDVRPVSRRWLAWRGGTVAGHDGEWLGVVAGALGAAIADGDAASVERCVAHLDGELTRQAEAFAATAARADGELDALRLAAVLTHNAGDVDQGLSYWRRVPADHALRARWARLAHERAERFAGAFARAAALYRALMAAEGHRNYPLREVRALRRDPDLLLPIAPLLDEWGATVATHDALSDGDRADVLATLVAGCRKVRGQSGYYRAIAGFIAAGGLDRCARSLPGAARKALADAELRKRVAVPRASFESSLRKQARRILDGG